MLKYQNFCFITNNILKVSPTSTYFIKTYSTSIKNEASSVKTVDLSYASYETAISEDKGLPPLIILHGLLGSKSNWTSMSKALHRSTGRKVIAVDSRNHGDSPHSSEHTYRHMAEDIVSLMKKLHIPKAAILGHSMGGRTAMVLALLQPSLVSSLTVCDISPVKTSPSIYSMDEIFEAMCLVKIPKGIPLSQARKLSDEQLQVAVPDLSIRSFIITNLVQADNNDYMWRVNLDTLRESFRSDVAVFPSEMNRLQYSGPTLFIGGALSDYISRDELPNIRKMFPHANLMFIDDAGHWVHSQKPEQFLKIVTKFLKNKVH